MITNMAKTKKKVISKKTVKKSSEPKAEKPKIYNVTVSILGKEYSIETDDIKEAILGLKPGKIAGKIIFTVRKGDSIAERVLHPFQARKLFINELMAEFFTKNIMLRLK